jgi:iron complex transport system ATP-binding protein
MLEARNICGGYNPKRNIVHDVSFKINEGDVLCVLGPNGCGKTTLFKIILGFLPKTAGSIIIEGEQADKMDYRGLAQFMAYIPQYHEPAFNYRVLDMVLLGRSAYVAPLSSPRSEDYSLAFEALEGLNIEHLAEREYTKISGGERQLVLIARAVCQQAKILVMDEPTANLDYANQHLVLKTILDLSKRGYSVVLSTHSPDQPFRLANKVLLMKGGKTVGYGHPDEILTSPTLKDVYGINIEVLQAKDSRKRCHSLCVCI